jgi:hypothetical protein
MKINFQVVSASKMYHSFPFLFLKNMKFHTVSLSIYKTYKMNIDETPCVHKFHSLSAHQLKMSILDTLRQLHSMKLDIELDKQKCPAEN